MEGALRPAMDCSFLPKQSACLPALRRYSRPPPACPALQACRGKHPVARWCCQINLTRILSPAVPTKCLMQIIINGTRTHTTHTLR
ncbi:hypothetical protein K456DRAFT_49991 [Colletotrichum gloeosporioides 23]|nr:hypothetical protein K456DRAFT_49991 [Colletotrichum gloeosporioides 23]